MVFSGRSSEAIKLGPRDPNMSSFLVRLADAQLFMHDYEVAVHWAKKVLQQPHFQWSRYAVFISALGHLGLQDEVEVYLQQVLMQRPDFSIAFVRETHLFSDPDDMEHYLEGLRKTNVS